MGRPHQSYGKLTSIEIKTNLKQSYPPPFTGFSNYLFRSKEEENAWLKILHD